MHHNKNSTISFSKIQNRCNVNWYKDVNFIEYTCCCYFRHTDIPSLRSKMAAFLLSSQHLDCLFFVTFIAVVVVHLIAHWQRHLTAKWRVQFIDAQCPVNFIAHWRVHFVCFDIICSFLLALVIFWAEQLALKYAFMVIFWCGSAANTACICKWFERP